ncbi:hypothetical protein J6590_076374 [Homalodisca vitripennis]|nr:hypothetical protein J6590_076374 [Homalodisca vitripennis]
MYHNYVLAHTLESATLVGKHIVACQQDRSCRALRLLVSTLLLASRTDRVSVNDTRALRSLVSTLLLNSVSDRVSVNETVIVVFESRITKMCWHGACIIQPLQIACTVLDGRSRDLFSGHSESPFGRNLYVNIDYRVKQCREWLLLGWVTAERSCPCKQLACTVIGQLVPSKVLSLERRVHFWMVYRYQLNSHWAQQKPISKMIAKAIVKICQRPGLVFILYPQAMAHMPFSNFWDVLFFFMLLCLGFNSQITLRTSEEVSEQQQSIRPEAKSLRPVDSTADRHITGITACSQFIDFANSLIEDENKSGFVMFVFAESEMVDGVRHRRTVAVAWSWFVRPSWRCNSMLCCENALKEGNAVLGWPRKFLRGDVIMKEVNVPSNKIPNFLNSVNRGVHLVVSSMLKTSKQVP